MSHSNDGRTRSWWGWGWADQALSDDACATYGALVAGLPDAPRPIPDLADLDLPRPRVVPPASLGGVVTSAVADRAGHTYGKAYRDVVRALDGNMAAAPDVVAYPSAEDDVIRVLDWAGDARVAVVPYGAGSSVVGGVEYRGGDHAGVVSLDMSRLDRVLEVDRTSRAARIQGGARGPDLEDQLRPAGLTLRHFPQSFEFSTLGGWLATRAGGHYATLHTHDHDLGVVAQAAAAAVPRLHRQARSRPRHLRHGLAGPVDGALHGRSGGARPSGRGQGGLAVRQRRLVLLRGWRVAATMS